MLPPVVTDADRAVVARQLGREPRTLRRVAVRCPFGAPAVTEQSPYGTDGGASLDYGIGGSRRGGSLKCLHAHVAFALARPGYELGERVLAEVEPRWPERCCSQ